MLGEEDVEGPVMAGQPGGVLEGTIEGAPRGRLEEVLDDIAEALVLAGAVDEAGLDEGFELPSEAGAG